jgi:hypothetical protein
MASPGDGILQLPAHVEKMKVFSKVVMQSGNAKLMCTADVSSVFVSVHAYMSLAQ